MGKNPFNYPKSIYTVEDCINHITRKNNSSAILDYFAGSGTTGHAVINLNREDGGKRKFILMEMGEYFDTVLLPRIKKVCFSPEWKDGKPKRMATAEEQANTPRLLKYHRLESYEDALDNLQDPRPTEQQKDILEQDAQIREQYMLRYMLDIETRDSPTLLDAAAFRDPFSYRLTIAREGKRAPVAVDLIETFNYLLGLRVRKRFVKDGIHIIIGDTLKAERHIILWRTVQDIEQADQQIRKVYAAVNSKHGPFAAIYANCQCRIPKAKVIEIAFRRLMFEGAE